MTASADHPPLAGLRILDLASYTPGPLCTSILVELGCDVVKVERPGTGDPGRETTPGTYQTLNHRKRIVRIDLKDPEGQAEVADLVDGMDVVVQGHPPCRADRLGIGAAVLTSRNPWLVYCSINGFGSVSTAAAHDIDVAARTGLLWLSGEIIGDGRAPTVIPYADIAAAHYAVTGILAALVRRGSTGRGAVLEVPMVAASLKTAEFRLAEYESAGRPTSAEFRSLPGYGVFRARDGRMLAVACVSEADWVNMVSVLPACGFAGDDRLQTDAGRKSHADVVRKGLAEAFATRPAAEWVRVLESAGVAAAQVRSPSDVLQDPLIAASGFARTGGPGQRPVVAFPVTGLDLDGG